MSHNPTYRTYPIKYKPAQIEADLDAFVRAADYQEGGRLSPIRWMENKVFNSYNEAEEWLKNTDKGWYDNRAVVYLDTSKARQSVKSKKAEDLQRRLDEWRTRRNEVRNTYHFADAKAALISCKECGSKIANKYMKKRNNCPVCFSSMLPPTQQKQLARAEEMIKVLNDQLMEEEKALNIKLLSKAEKRWLVYFDYHT